MLARRLRQPAAASQLASRTQDLCKAVSAARPRSASPLRLGKPTLCLALICTHCPVDSPPPGRASCIIAAGADVPAVSVYCAVGALVHGQRLPGPSWPVHRRHGHLPTLRARSYRVVFLSSVQEHAQTVSPVMLTETGHRQILRPRAQATCIQHIPPMKLPASDMPCFKFM